MLSEESLSTYLDKLASSLPAPGAGCAAALTGAQAASLLAMVCSLTLKKKKYEQVRKEIEGLHGYFNQKRRLMLNLAEADMISFESVIKAYKLSKEGEEDKNTRTRQIQLAYKKAAEVPEILMKECLELLLHAERLSHIGYKKVVSDVEVAVCLLHSCVKSSKINLEYNLKQIKDKGFIKEKLQQIKKMDHQDNPLKTI